MLNRFKIALKREKQVSKAMWQSIPKKTQEDKDISAYVSEGKMAVETRKMKRNSSGHYSKFPKGKLI